MAVPSSRDLINAAKDKIKDVASQVQSAEGYTLRVGFVAYRCVGNHVWLQGDTHECVTALITAEMRTELALFCLRALADSFVPS